MVSEVTCSPFYRLEAAMKSTEVELLHEQCLSPHSSYMAGAMILFASTNTSHPLEGKDLGAQLALKSLNQILPCRYIKLPSELFVSLSGKQGNDSPVRECSSFLLEHSASSGLCKTVSINTSSTLLQVSSEGS